MQKPNHPFVKYSYNFYYFLHKLVRKILNIEQLVFVNIFKNARTLFYLSLIHSIQMIDSVTISH